MSVFYDKNKINGKELKGEAYEMGKVIISRNVVIKMLKILKKKMSFVF